MNRSAPRSIDQYLKALREELAGEDAALIQDALYDAEEYLRAEVAAHSDKSESDVLELIASTYGAPDEVASAYRDTEAKVKAAMTTPRAIAKSGTGAFFGVFLDPRAYTSLFFMFLSLATGVIYFTFAVTGLSLSAGLAVLVVGIPFFLVFVALSRVVSLAEGRLIEAMTGERMPRRPVHQGNTAGILGARLADAEGSAHLDHARLFDPDVAARHRLLRHGGGRLIGEPRLHFRAARRNRRALRVVRHTPGCAHEPGMARFPVGLAADGADGRAAADAAHAPGARHRTAARHVCKGLAGGARHSVIEPPRAWNKAAVSAYRLERACASETTACW